MPSRRSPRRSLSVAFGAILLGSSLVAGCAEAGVRATRADTADTVPDTVPDTTIPPPDHGRPPGSGDDPLGVGDDLFPALGSPSIDVQQYRVTLAYDAASDGILGTVVIDLIVTDDVDVVHLDADGPLVSEVAVDGVDATFDVADGDLAIDLPEPLTAGSATSVVVGFTVDPRGGTGSTGLPSGWFNTPDGSYTLNEPDGAHSWLPSNDHPSDKATYRFTLMVPPGVTAVANGRLDSHATTADGEIWVWVEDRPMATYLIQVLTGDYEVVQGEGPHGLPLTHAVLRSNLATAQPLFDLTVEQIDFLEQWFGPYPLDRYGLAITDSESGLAMETQERSLFSRDDLLAGEPDYMAHLLLSHELTHQWFGDAVSPARWTDIWMNESFATYGQWMWMEHAGFGSVDAAAGDALRFRPPGSSASPTVDELFGFNSYDGGAVVLHALRQTIGDDDFFALLRRWVAENNGTSRTTEDFIALANDESGQDLTDFFDTWLFAEQPPSRFP